MQRYKNIRKGLIVTLFILITITIICFWYGVLEAGIIDAIFIAIICIAFISIHTKIHKVETIVNNEKKFPVASRLVYKRHNIVSTYEETLIKNKFLRNKYYKLNRIIHSVNRSYKHVKSIETKYPEAFSYICTCNEVRCPFDFIDELIKCEKSLKNVRRQQKKYDRIREISESCPECILFYCQSSGIPCSSQQFLQHSFYPFYWKLSDIYNKVKFTAKEINKLKDNIHYNVNDANLVQWFLKTKYPAAWNRYIPISYKYDTTNIVNTILNIEAQIEKENTWDILKREYPLGFQCYEMRYGPIRETGEKIEDLRNTIISLQKECQLTKLKVFELRQKYPLSYTNYVFHKTHNCNCDFMDNWALISYLFQQQGSFSELEKILARVEDIKKNFPHAYYSLYGYETMSLDKETAETIIRNINNISAEENNRSRIIAQARSIKKEYKHGCCEYLETINNDSGIKEIDPDLDMAKAIISDKQKIISLQTEYDKLYSRVSILAASCPDAIKEKYPCLSKSIEDFKKILEDEQDIRYRQSALDYSRKIDTIIKDNPDGYRLYCNEHTAFDYNITKDKGSIYELEKMYCECNKEQTQDFFQFASLILFGQASSDPINWSGLAVRMVYPHLEDFKRFPDNIKRANIIISSYPDAFCKLYPDYTASYSEVIDIISKEESIIKAQNSIDLDKAWAPFCHSYSNGVRLFKRENQQDIKPNPSNITIVKDLDGLFKDVMSLAKNSPDGFKTVLGYDDRSLVRMTSLQLRQILTKKGQIENSQNEINAEKERKFDYLRTLKSNYPHGYMMFCEKHAIQPTPSLESYNVIMGHDVDIVAYEKKYEDKERVLREEREKRETERKRIEEEQRVLNLLASRRKPEADKIIQYLERRIIGPKFFYHFTNRKNIASIKRHGGLFSWYYLETHGIALNNDEEYNLSRRLDCIHNLEDYVHLSFCDDHPMKYRREEKGDDMVLLKISLEVATFETTAFSNMNATDNNESHGIEFSDLEKVNFMAVYAHNLKGTSPYFKPHQAEVLVKTHVPLKYILNINEF